MHAISSYCGNRPTNTRRRPARCKHANTQTEPITIHCAAKLSAQSKKALREKQTLRRENFSPSCSADPLPGGAGGPKFNQKLSHYLHLQIQFGEGRCTQFRVIVATDPQINTQTNKDRTNYNTLCRS